MTSINSVDRLSPVEFDKLYFQSFPVIHKQAINNTKYYKKWSFDYFKSKYGSRLVNIAHSKNGYFDYTNKEIFEIREVLFSDGIDYFTSKDEGSHYYLAQTSIPDNFPELVNEIEIPPCMLNTDALVSKNLWIGGAGCISPLHYDRFPNFLVQVKGRKKLIMFSPENYDNLYPHQESVFRHLSRIDLRDIDYESFPSFNKAKPFECILEPGDILYIPPGWWHEVHSLEASISLNLWFRRFDIVKELESRSVKELCKRIKWFVGNGCSVNSKDSEGELLLIKAIEMDLTNVVEALLFMGANPNSKSQKYKPDMSAISFAKKKANQEVVELLHQAGAIDC